MAADATGSDTLTEATPTKVIPFQIIIEGDDSGVMTFYEDEVACTLAIEKAMFKYSDEKGHPRMNMRVVCSENRDRVQMMND